jgi:L-threonylcarbamoyladenylate synthase
MVYVSQFKTKLAVRLLQQGELIAYPTEAIYGLGCDPLNEDAVVELLALKQRPVDKGLILIASSWQQLKPYLVTDNSAMLEPVLATWPGPTTWIIPAQRWVPKWLTGQHNSLAVRVTKHPLVTRLCKNFGGPIVSTSANISDQQPARTPYQILKTFGSQTPYIVKGSTSGFAQATPIFDAMTGKRLR